MEAIRPSDNKPCGGITPAGFFLLQYLIHPVLHSPVVIPGSREFFPPFKTGTPLPVNDLPRHSVNALVPNNPVVISCKNASVSIDGITSIQTNSKKLPSFTIKFKGKEYKDANRAAKNERFEFGIIPAELKDNLVTFDKVKTGKDGTVAYKK